MERFYISRHGKRNYAVAETTIVSSPSVFSVFSGGLAWKIYREFSSPACPIDIAKKLGIHEQNIYYYVRKFKKERLIREVSREQRHGTTARFYRCSSSAFSVVLEKLQPATKPAGKPAVLEPFVANGTMNSTIVVGSPDPHGPYKSRASDGCCAIDLALFIGSFTENVALPNYRLDVQVRGGKDLKGNLILVGGPIANMITRRINSRMPAFFDLGNMAAIKSSATKRRYMDDECGVVSVINSPFDSSGRVLVVAGNRFAGTRAAILALIKRPSEVLAGLAEGSEFSRVVKGFDGDGDGVIDSVEIIE